LIATRIQNSSFTGQKSKFSHQNSFYFILFEVSAFFEKVLNPTLREPGFASPEGRNQKRLNTKVNPIRCVFVGGHTML
jgi:hypothetical protein